MSPAMKVRILLTDIFDLEAPTAMFRRMEHAFGADGQEFWGGFFPCNKAHPNDRIVYLFTEYQMHILHKWLIDKYTTLGDRIRKNLDYSRQKTFLEPIPAPDGRYGDRIRACYVKSGSENQPKLLQVLFMAPPYMKTNDTIHFFDGGFKEDPTVAYNEDERSRILTGLLALRPQIEAEFGGPGKKDTKWLYYLGSRISEKDHEAIEYCSENSACPFAEKRNFLST